MSRFESNFNLTVAIWLDIAFANKMFTNNFARFKGCQLPNGEIISVYSIIIMGGPE